MHLHMHYIFRPHKAAWQLSSEAARESSHRTYRATNVCNTGNRGRYDGCGACTAAQRALPYPQMDPLMSPASVLQRSRRVNLCAEVTTMRTPGIEMKVLMRQLSTLFKHTSTTGCQSGSFKERCMNCGSGPHSRNVSQTWVSELKARVDTTRTIVPGSLTMSYERIEPVILRGRAIGTSVSMGGSGLKRRSRTCVQPHAPTQRGLRVATGGVDLPLVCLE